MTTEAITGKTAIYRYLQKRGINSSAIDEKKIDLKDGLNAKERKDLGLEKETTLDRYLRQGWKRNGDQGMQTGKEADVAEVSEFKAMYADIDAYAKAHGITLEEAEALYFADDMTFGREDLEKTKANREKTSSKWVKEYKDWKKENKGKTFADWAKAKFGIKDNNPVIKNLKDFQKDGKANEKELVAFLLKNPLASRFRAKLQTSVLKLSYAIEGKPYRKNYEIKTLTLWFGNQEIEKQEEEPKAVAEEPKPVAAASLPEVSAAKVEEKKVKPETAWLAPAKVIYDLLIEKGLFEVILEKDGASYKFSENFGKIKIEHSKKGKSWTEANPPRYVETDPQIADQKYIASKLSFFYEDQDLNNVTAKLKEKASSKETLSGKVLALSVKGRKLTAQIEDYNLPLAPLVPSTPARKKAPPLPPPIITRRESPSVSEKKAESKPVEAEKPKLETDEAFNKAKQILGDKHWKDLGSPSDYKQLAALLKNFKEFKAKIDGNKPKTVIEAAKEYRTNYFVYEEKSSPVLTINKPDQHYFVDLNRIDGEKQLFTLSDSAKVEEAWLYIEYELEGRKYYRWFECGEKESENGTATNYYIISKLISKNAKISNTTFYHIHPKGLGPNAPSGLDIMGLAHATGNLRKNYAYSSNLDFIVITPRGKYKLKPDIKNRKYAATIDHAISKTSDFRIPKDSSFSWHTPLEAANKLNGPGLKVKFYSRAEKVKVKKEPTIAQAPPPPKVQVKVEPAPAVSEKKAEPKPDKAEPLIPKPIAPYSRGPRGLKNIELKVATIDLPSTSDSKKASTPSDTKEPLFKGNQEGKRNSPVFLDLDKVYYHPGGTEYKDKELTAAITSEQKQKIISDTKQYKVTENADKQQILGEATKKIEKRIKKMMKYMGIKGDGVIELQVNIYQRFKKEQIERKKDGSFKKIPKGLGRVLVKYKGFTGDAVYADHKDVKDVKGFNEKINYCFEEDGPLSIKKEIKNLPKEKFAELFFAKLGKNNLDGTPAYLETNLPATYTIKVKVSKENISILPSTAEKKVASIR